MTQLRIAADSSCDLLALEGVDFVAVPLTIRTDTEEFRDDAALDVGKMVSTLRNTKGRSYSACPNIADWEHAFGEEGDVSLPLPSQAASQAFTALRAPLRRPAPSAIPPGASMLSTPCLPALKWCSSSKRRCLRCAPARTSTMCAGR